MSTLMERAKALLEECGVKPSMSTNLVPVRDVLERMDKLIETRDKYQKRVESDNYTISKLGEKVKSRENDTANLKTMLEIEREAKSAECSSLYQSVLLAYVAARAGKDHQDGYKVGKEARECAMAAAGDEAQRASIVTLKDGEFHPGS